MFEKRIIFSAKCDDRFSLRLHDETSDKPDINYEGYVPSFLGGGDYVRLNIDLETGQIMDWPGKEAVLAALKEDDEEDE